MKKTPTFVGTIILTIMSYITVKIQAFDDLADILKAELSEIGFDAFLETEDGFEATAEEVNFSEAQLKEVFEQYNADGVIPYTIEQVAKQNWNALWESNFQAITIGQDCYIRASHHAPREGFRYEIVITPKMSFGTGHHATTSLMIRNQLKVAHEGKRVFDIGSGTGILGIMASKLGASHVDACDIEDWSVENALENATINSVSLHAFHGTAALALDNAQYDIVLANINKNVILQELSIYQRLLQPGGMLLLSGFYKQDVPDIENMLQKLAIQTLWVKEQDNWVSMVCCRE